MAVLADMNAVSTSLSKIEDLRSVVLKRKKRYF